MVILQIGTNDLADDQCTHETLISAITDLVDTLLYTYHVRYVAVLQILHRFPPTVPTKHKVDIVAFNGKVDLSNDGLTTELATIKNCRFWRHKSFLGSISKSHHSPRRCPFVRPIRSKKIFLQLTCCHCFGH